MCGIAGFIYSGEYETGLLRQMGEAIKHRGPDSSGVMMRPFDDQRTIALVHQRLAIQDLSASAHQPMMNDKGDIALVFNGELYNVKQLRQLLLDHGLKPRSSSDTELILLSYELFGLDAVKDWHGMFAIAIDDQRTKTCHLIRDRFGIKPLYVYDDGRGIVFGSELKPMMLHPQMKKDIDPHGLSLFLHHGYITSPHTIFKNTIKLHPGTILSVGAKGTTQTTYWSVGEVKKNALIEEKPTQQWLNELDDLMTESVAERMISDVPLGAFLSGGVDSSLIVSLMKKSAHKVNTFSIGFHEDGFNEAPFAKEVANYLGTNHHELYVGTQEAQDVIRDLAHYYDEPFADSSQIPTMLVSQMARQKVTVCLSGDGGDELFCGYGRYDTVLKLEKMKPLAHIAAGIPGFSSMVRACTKQSKYSQFFELTDPLGPINYSYLNFIRHHNLIKDYVPHMDRRYEDITEYAENWQEKHMLQDLVTYLPDDILHKVDRASMAYGLETRAPFVDDHRIFEMSCRMPHHLKYRQGQKKYILKELCYRYVPQQLIDRPKAGFGLPIHDWLRGDLQYLIKHYLDDTLIEKQGLFCPKTIHEMKQQFFGKPRGAWLTSRMIPDLKLHQDGQLQRLMWHLLVFQMWYEHHMAPQGAFV